MRCHICDAPLSSINFNKDHGDIDPCFTCLEVINDVFGKEPDDDEALTEEEAMSLEAVDEPTTEELMTVVEDTYYNSERWSNR